MMKLSALRLNAPPRSTRIVSSCYTRRLCSTRAAAAPLLSDERIEVAPGYNRWLQVPCAAAVSGVCGSNYAWSAFNAPLSRELGVVAAASGDWPLTAVLPNP